MTHLSQEERPAKSSPAVVDAQLTALEERVAQLESMLRDGSGRALTRPSVRAKVAEAAGKLEAHGKGADAVSGPDPAVARAKEVDGSELASFTWPFSSPQRVAILKALAERRLTVAELSADTGLAGGQLYHHLKELTRAGLVASAGRGTYEMTRVGLSSFVSLAELAWAHRRDPASEGRGQGLVETEPRHRAYQVVIERK